MPRRAFIFDVDGTLVDTNDLHARAWQLVFERHGVNVEYSRIRDSIGMGGDRVVPRLAGEPMEETRGDELRHEQGEEFRRLLAAAPKRVFPGVRELLLELERRGVATAIATSAQQETFANIERSFELQLSRMVGQVVTSSGIESKPAPDIVEKVLEELKLPPESCVMVGDTPYDALASTRAGVPCIGVRSGGWEAGPLRDAGARTVYADTADLLAHLDEELAKLGQHDG